MTPTQFFFHPAAIEEAESAARWYRERSPITATRFVDELNRVIDKIGGSPALAAGHAQQAKSQAAVLSLLGDL